MRSEMKSKFLVITINFVLLIVLGACSSNDKNSDENNGPEISSSDEEVTLTIQIPNTTLMDGYEAVFTEIEEKLNIKTDVELVPAGGEGDNLIKTRLATGEFPDMAIYNSGSLFQALNGDEHFLDLTDEPFMEKVEDSFKDVVSVNDRVYGIPDGASSAGGWLYNKKIYDELGLSIPHTWDELMENNRKVKDAGKIAVIGSYQDTWTSQLIILADYYNIHSNIPSFADDYTNNKAKYLDTPIALRGFEKLQEIHDEGLLNDELNSVSYDDGMRMIAEGEGAHYPMLTSAVPAIVSSFPDLADDVGFFGQPGDDANDHGATIWMPGGIYFNKDIENVDAARKWAEYFLSDEGMTTFMEHQEAAGPYMVKGIELPEDSAEAIKDIEPYLEEGNVAPALEFFSPIKGPNLEQILIEVGMGLITAEEGAEKYDRDVEKQAQQLGIDGW